MPPFTHLHVHSGFSTHYGCTTPRRLAELASSADAERLALTDRDGVYGAVAHVQACRDAALAPILGADLAVHGSLAEPLGRVVLLAHGAVGRSDSTQWAQAGHGQGYAALCRMVTAAHDPGPRARRSSAPSLSRDALSELLRERPHLSVLLGPSSDVGRLVEARRLPEARAALRAWCRLVPRELLAVEVVCWLAEPGQPGSVTPATRMLSLAEAHGLTAVLTNQVRYGEPDEAATADISDSARTLLPLDDLDRDRRLTATGQAWLKPASAMRRIARMVVDVSDHTTTATDLLAATERLAERCTLDPEVDLGWGHPRMPEAGVIGIEGDPMRALTMRARAAVPDRYAQADPARLHAVHDRLDHELADIETLGFAPYFLTVAKVVNLIHEMGVRVQARGSGVGSMLNYLLRISGVEPLDNGLLWERFLSPERRTLPDIDLDVESARRHDIYRRIFAEFGDQRVTLMSMTNTYRSRGAVRDAGLALGIEAERIDAIAKELWRFSAGGFRRALAEKPELADFAEQVRTSPQLDLLVDATERLDALPRHISMHPCGVIVSDLSLLDRTPVQSSGIGLPMSQFDKHSVDPMGLIKLDVLGVRMQSAMAYAVSEVNRLHETPLDLDDLPLDDPATFETIRSTHTLGIFQIESPGQMELVGKLQPEQFNDLTVDISLFRPGPMKNNMPLQYLQARHGEVSPAVIHPRIDPILRETMGVVVFHEQVMRLLDELTGCGLAKADVLRRAMADDQQLDQIEQMVFRNASLRGISSSVTDRCWRMLRGFASFGFAKAHGAAFALPTYQSAWLKTHHPAEFLAGLLTHDPGMWPKDLLLSEARRLGVPLLPLDVQRSGLDYRVERLPDRQAPSLGIRVSVAELVGSTRAEQERLVAHQPFANLQDFRDRVRPRRSTFEALARVGALDAFIGRDPRRRHELLALIRSITATPIRIPPRQLAFDLDLPTIHHAAAPVTDLHARTQTDLEIEHLGIGVEHHVVSRFHPLFRRLGVTPARDLVGLPGGSEVLVAGVRRATNTPPMRGGRRVVFVSLDDGTGVSNIVFFAEAQERIRSGVFRTQLMLVRGVTRRSGARGISVTGSMAWNLVDVQAQQQTDDRGSRTLQPRDPQSLLRTAG
ncbi:MAG: DNA polymerase III subunit alpha [Pseudoclavibacter sp.]